MMEVDDCYEKEMLVDAPKNGKWKPNINLLMHVASHDDFGAHPESIEETRKEMLAGGFNPKKVKVRVMVYVEEID